MTVNFRKTLASGLVAASLAVVSGGAMAVSTPVEIGVTFTGTILDNTCATPTTTTENMTVDFGRISQTNFGSAGEAGAIKDFSIEFSDCGSQAGDVQVWFKGTADDVDETALANTVGEGYSTGVAVQVWKDETTQLEIGNSLSPVLYEGLLTSETEGGPISGTMNLIAKAVQTGSSLPSVGTLRADGTLVVQYP